MAQAKQLGSGILRLVIVIVSSTASKGKGQGKGQGQGGAKGKKGKTATETHRCCHCQSEGAKLRCSQCHRAWYCGQPCQKKHWKHHRKACVAVVAGAARQATTRREATAARGTDGIDKSTCVLSVGPVVAPVELPCGHAYRGTCLAGSLRRTGKEGGAGVPAVPRGAAAGAGWAVRPGVPGR